MTPAIETAKRYQCIYTLHEYARDSDSESWGQEAAHALSVPAEQIFKTLVVELDSSKLGVALIPVSASLNLKFVARALGAKKAHMAAPEQVERKTGYVLGGVSPLGQKTTLPTVIDASAQTLPTMFVSAGRRGLEIELAPAELARITHARFAHLARL